jgi:hypothetical protein
MRLWGISPRSRHLKRRLTTQTGEIFPEGEIARPRVQWRWNRKKCAGSLCPREDPHLTSMINMALPGSFRLRRTADNQRRPDCRSY